MGNLLLRLMPPARARALPLLGILTSELLGLLGGFITELSLIWWVIRHTANPVLLGVLTALVFLPLNLGGLASGLLVQRFGARRLLLVSRVAAFSGAVVLTLLVASGQLSIVLLMILAFVSYLAISPAAGAEGSRVPALARHARWPLARYNGLSQAVPVIAQVGGAGLGGLLIDSIGTPSTLVVASLLLGMALLATAATFPRDRVRPGHALSLGGWHALSRSALRHQTVRAVGIARIGALGLWVSLQLALAQVLLPVFVSTRGLPAQALSSPLLLAGVSALAGALLYPRLTRRIGWVRLLLLVGGFDTLALGAVSALPGYPVLLAGLAVMSGGTALAGAALVTELQRGLPAPLLAQSLGLWQGLVLTMTSPTLLLSGALAEHGLRLAAGCLAGASLLGWLVAVRAGSDANAAGRQLSGGSAGNRPA